MTRETAINKLNWALDNNTIEDVQSAYEYIIALKMAIKALEQQPSEGAEVIKVSKGTVKARQGRYVIYDVEWLKKHFYATEEKIYGQPKQPCDDTISRGAVLDLAKDLIIPLKDGATYKHRCIDPQCVRELPPVQPKSRWIPVSEKLPKDNGYYLTTTMYHEVYCDYFEEGRFNRTETVIAWQPLPKPYEPTN